MRTPEENIELSNVLFPDIQVSSKDILKKYPKRNCDGMVLRFAPSPTGFLHIGSIYTGLVCTKLARQTKGVSILRIEDTDKKREIVNGIDMIVNGLKSFGIEFDEGMKSETDEVGMYGPYLQSKRIDIYKAFAKELVSKGFAYPCFLTEDELEDIRKKQKELGVRSGCYGKWAIWRDASLKNIKEKIQKEKNFAIRLYSTGNMENTFTMKDLVKGGVTLRENDMDAVLLKSDGYPTYHFAHPIDDVLMGVSHIVRGDEWFSSVSLHIELFTKLGFEELPYAHLSPLMKSENGKKRKLSKRKDPEASVSYYTEKGYPKEGMLEYLLNIANSNFYDWRLQNSDKDINEFELKLEKFNSSGALFDIVKLDDTCKNYIATLSAEEVYEKVLEWADSFEKEVASLLKNNKEYCIKIFNIERTGERIRKDIVKFEDVKEQLTIFFDELLEDEKVEDISEKISNDIQKKVIERYLDGFTINGTQEEWFENIKSITSELGVEKVGDIAMILRVAVTKRTKTPDLYQIMQVLGEEKVKERLQKYADMMV